jgi:hypothetical protein
VTPVISSFTNNVNIVEVGSTVSSVVLNWVLNKNVSTQSLNNSINAINAALRQYTHSTSFTAQRTYTLTVDDGATEVTANSTVYFRHKIYWGANVKTELNMSDADIIALDNQFGTTRAISKSIECENQYMYVCYPASWGAAQFKVNGLNSTAWESTTRDFVNASGNTTSFLIYRSTFLQNGSNIELQVL